MNLDDESQLAELRLAFQRHLPRRTEVIGRRLQRFLQSGWDINGLALIHADARRLGQDSARHGFPEAGEYLTGLADLLDDPLAQETLPDPTTGERLWNLAEKLVDVVPRAPDPVRESTPRQLGNSDRAESPPLTYWRRWGQDAPPATIDAEPGTPAASAPSIEEQLWEHVVPNQKVALPRVSMDAVATPAPTAAITSPKPPAPAPTPTPHP